MEEERVFEEMKATGIRFRCALAHRGGYLVIVPAFRYEELTRLEGVAAGRLGPAWSFAAEGPEVHVDFPGGRF